MLFSYTPYDRGLFIVCVSVSDCKNVFEIFAVNAGLHTLAWATDNCFNTASMTTQDVQCWNEGGWKLTNTVRKKKKKKNSADFGRNEMESGGVQEKGEGQH